MNERIQKLYKETTGKDWVYDFDPDYAEMFAELIVRECIARCDDENSQKYIMAHFGMKESDWS